MKIHLKQKTNNPRSSAAEFYPFGGWAPTDEQNQLSKSKQEKKFTEIKMKINETQKQSDQQGSYPSYRINQSINPKPEQRKSLTS
jgi:hypothetical protein